MFTFAYQFQYRSFADKSNAVVKRFNYHKFCQNPMHVSRTGKTIQKHTCRLCFLERFRELRALNDGCLNRWEIACILTREFYNYLCSCCILEACVSDMPERCKIGLGKKCSHGHFTFSKQRFCSHGIKICNCHLCTFDPRAIPAWHDCTSTGRHCTCNLVSDFLFSKEGSTDEDHERLAQNLLKYAKDLENAAKDSSAALPFPSHGTLKHPKRTKHTVVAPIAIRAGPVAKELPSSVRSSLAGVSFLEALSSSSAFTTLSSDVTQTSRALLAAREEGGQVGV